MSFFSHSDNNFEWVFTRGPQMCFNCSYCQNQFWETPWFEYKCIPYGSPRKIACVNCFIKEQKLCVYCFSCGGSNWECDRCDKLEKKVKCLETHVEFLKGLETQQDQVFHTYINDHECGECRGCEINKIEK